MTSPLCIVALLCCLSLLGCASGQGAAPHPVPESDLWLTYSASPKAGASGGGGRHVVLIAAEQEYRSEQALPMLAKILAEHHGYHTTVLFLTNDDGLVDPTLPAPFEDAAKTHRVPGLEHLATADALIWESRFLHLTDADKQHFHDYFDAGKPIIALRTANHGFRGGMPYTKDGKNVPLGEMLGGAFMGHHGGWKREGTRGFVVEENKDHPILRGVSGVWGTSDVYRCHKEDTVPEDCTALLMGQPTRTLEPDAPDNTDKVPLPIAWTKTWVGNAGKESPIFHFTMGSAKDFENEGVRRVTINAVYWGLGLSDRIDPSRSVAIIGEYEPMKDGFNYEALGVKPRPARYYK